MAALLESELTPELRARIADYEVLGIYDRQRFVRYGDMAASRRKRELNRLGDALLAAGVPLDRTGNFPAPSQEELRAAWYRVLAPRWARWAKSPGALHGTREAKATREAWRATAQAVGLIRTQPTP